jgi:cysteine dioxygenase
MRDLLRLAAESPVPPDITPADFTDRPYTRIPVERTADTEVVVIGFAGGQTSSVHDHRGSRCVVRVVSGRVLETLFRRHPDGTLEPARSRVLTPGTVSGLEGEEVHQITNLDPAGTMLLNVYSPPTSWEG